jgi:hypothetical protein
MGYDIPSGTEGDSNTTISDQSLLVSISSPTSRSCRAA